ncbi:replication-associated recombination protein A [Candidatus Gottesmanbacteria bacterium]|nr:replication-associated recombination protein A [Candidatus Gottesmanbacteria bacterium]
MDPRPLAEQLRPSKFNEFVGQPHLVGENGLITKLLESGKIPSLIFWGPPGSGKTTLARLIATQSDSDFVEFSAVATKLEMIKDVVKKAQEVLKLYGRKTILFIDEIHRFNKSQQAIFLPYVENGDIILIASTTENPSFEVISPLLSRSKVVVFYKHQNKELSQIAKIALKKLKKNVDKNALKFLIQSSNGDGRIIITTLDIASSLVGNRRKLTMQDIETALQKKMLEYDKKGEEHYNTISAFIKSMRSSDVNAALYYLARMVEAGEDPLFIARRMVIFASEDIGMAVPTALVVANEVFRACDTIGYPECAINLAHGVVYLSSAKKDRRSYDAYFSAVADVKKYGNLAVPLNIRNAPTKLMKDLNYGKDYEMYTKESLLPDKLKGKKYYKK